MRRTLPLIAASLLLLGLAACGNQAETAPPSLAPSTGPADSESCSSAEALSLFAAFRMVDVGTQLEKGSPADAAIRLDQVVEQANKSMTDAKDPRVKAIVDEYKTVLTKLQTALAAPGTDKAKLVADVDVALDQFDKSEQKLKAICVEPVPSEAPGKAGCNEIEKTELDQGLKLLEPVNKLMEAGSDRAKIDAAIKEFNAAVDEFIAQLKAAAAKVTNTELKAAVDIYVAELANFKTELAEAAKDSTKLKVFIEKGPSKTGEEKIAAICGK